MDEGSASAGDRDPWVIAAPSTGYPTMPARGTPPVNLSETMSPPSNLVRDVGGPLLPQRLRWQGDPRAAAPSASSSGQERFDVPVRRRGPSHRFDAFVTPSSGRYHTLVPRGLCLAGFFVNFSLPVVLALVDREGHSSLMSGEFHLDPASRGTLLSLAIGGTICFLTGWMWWAMAAALNARSLTKWAVAPWLAPAAYTSAIAAGLAVPLAPASVRLYVASSAIVLGAIVHFGVLSTYRRTARAIGCPTTYFTRLIVLPWTMLAVAGLIGFFIKLVGDPFPAILIGISAAFLGAIGLSTYQAMAAFDRACVGTHMRRNQLMDLPDFLKG